MTMAMSEAQQSATQGYGGSSGQVDLQGFLGSLGLGKLGEWVGRKVGGSTGATIGGLAGSIGGSFLPLQAGPAA